MSDYLAGNQLRLLYNGNHYFPFLLRALREAKREIFLESYIFAHDQTGQEVMDALVAAALRGVEVKLHLDGFGAAEFPEKWRRRLLDAGGYVLFFRPGARHFSLNRAQLRRLHRKLVVIDGEIAFVGGINVINDFNQSPAGLPPRYDYAVEVRGPVVARMHRAADELWRQTAWVHLKKDWAHRSRVHPDGKSAKGQTAAQFVIRNNLRHRRDIEHQYRMAIDTARHEIIIANAYFLPGYGFRHALMAAAQRGVRVVLLLQGRVDHLVLHYASQGLYRQLLSAGVEIYEYRRGFMHAKVATIDGRWSTVGSSNIDPFSLLVAREANLFVRDMSFASLLRGDLRRVLRDYAIRIQLDDLRRVGLFQRMAQWICYGCVRLAMSLSGYGGSRNLE
jgi:cardiolipin synthase